MVADSGLASVREGEGLLLESSKSASRRACAIGEGGDSIRLVGTMSDVDDVESVSAVSTRESAMTVRENERKSSEVRAKPRDSGVRSVRREREQ